MYLDNEQKKRKELSESPPYVSMCPRADQTEFDLVGKDDIPLNQFRRCYSLISCVE